VRRHPRLLLAVCVLMGAWLLIASARRLAFDLVAGVDVDWATLASFALGLIGLLLAVPAIDDAVPHHDRNPSP
jgi:hypothetical protein